MSPGSGEPREPQIAHLLFPAQNTDKAHMHRESLRHAAHMINQDENGLKTNLFYVYLQTDEFSEEGFFLYHRKLSYETYAVGVGRWPLRRERPQKTVGD